LNLIHTRRHYRIGKGGVKRENEGDEKKDQGVEEKG
jgi:hypothetical protein